MTSRPQTLDLVELDPVPETVRLLTDPEIERLETRHTHFYVPSARGGVQPLCVTCAGEGEFQWWSKDRTEVVTYRCDCIGQWVLYAAFLNAGIDPKYQWWTWDDTKAVETAAQIFVLDYIDRAAEYVRAGAGMFLYGDRGIGKTMLSVLALKKLVSQGYDGYFIQALTLLDTYKEGWKDIESKVWFDRRVKTAKVLVIDDLGKEIERHKEFATFMDEILRTRIGLGFPTIITTNFDPHFVTVKYTEGIGSLLQETMLYHEFKGEDYRLKSQQEALHDQVDLGLKRPAVVG